MSAQKIVPFLWFDNQAREAARFYASVFKAKPGKVNTLDTGPMGSIDVVEQRLLDQDFMLMSAGPLFKVNPSISFLVACKTAAEVDRLWNKLNKGGKAMMELGAYPFSPRYGWTEDRYGVSWQVMHMAGRPVKQRIIPTLMFTGKQAGNAEKAIRLYASLFKKSKVGDILRYPKGGVDKPGTVQHASFRLEGREFAAMDSALKHKFAFNEGVSLFVHCKNQKEVDHYWKLSADPRFEQCGWLKDRFGVSWQVCPDALLEMERSKDKKKVARVVEAFMRMKKFDIKALEKAFKGA
jgi:predicted 3-demethylubiquinone-9 3-methyltransferase (glyoxalase superfamily)